MSSTDFGCWPKVNREKELQNMVEWAKEKKMEGVGYSPLIDTILVLGEGAENGNRSNA